MGVQTLAWLKSNPQYLALAPSEQMEVAQHYLSQELSANPGFLQQDARVQEEIMKNYLLDSVTFQDEQRYGQPVKTLMLDTLAGKSGAAPKKQVYEGFTSAVQSSGILATGARALDAIIGNEVGSEDRKRALQYFKAADSLINRQDAAGEIGSILGTVADVVGVSLVASPLTAAARAGVQVAARGGSALVKAAQAAGKVAPILKPMLNTLGPVATESLIEAIPYFLTEELRRSANGEVSALGSGALEVAKTLGKNAAIDFVVGSAALGVGSALLKGGKVLFGKSSGFKIGMETEAQLANVADQIATGKMDPSILENLDPVLKDRVLQTAGIRSYLKEGVLEPASARWEKVQYLSHDLNGVVGRVGTGEYRLWNIADDGVATAKIYTNLNDLEDSLSYKAYSAYMELPATKKDTFLSAHSAWALPRGKTLAEQGGMLGSPGVLLGDPVLAEMATKGMKIQPVSKRAAISLGEAQSLLKTNTPNTTVIAAKIPLSGDIVKNINRGDINLMRGMGPSRVAMSDTPNAIFVGVKAADQSIYDAATIEATKAIAKDPSLTLDMARASILLDNGFDHIKHLDNTVEFFTSRNMKLIGDVEDIIAKPIGPTLYGDISAKTVVTESKLYSAGAKTLQKNEPLIMDAAIRALRSQDTEDLRNFTKLYTSSAGDNVEVNVIRMVNKSDVTVERIGNKISISAPASIGTYADESKFFSSLMRGLDNVVSPGTSAKASDYWATKFAAKIQAFELPSGSKASDWIADVSAKLGGTSAIVDDIIDIKLPSGNAMFKTSDDAVSYLARRLGDSSIIKADLQRQGIRVVDTKAGVQARSIRTGKLMDSAENFERLLDKLEYRPGSIDIAYGPKVINIRNGAIDFEVAGTNTYSDPSKAFQALQKFTDTRSIALKKIIHTAKDGELLALPNTRYEVLLTEFNAKKTFDTLQEARDYLRRGGDLEIDELKEMASNKFANLYIENGQYIVYSGPTRYVANTMEELKTVMKKIPDITDNVPSILIDPEVDALASDLINQYKLRSKYRAGPNAFNLPPEFTFDPKMKAINAIDSIGAMTENLSGWVDNVVKHTGNKQLGDIFYKFKNLVRTSNGETNYANRALEKIFSDNNGKLFKPAVRKKIFYHLAGQSAEDSAKLLGDYRTRYGKALEALTPDEEIAAGKVKVYLEALGQKFGISYDKLIYNYMPRLRAFASDAKNTELLNKLTSARDLAQHALGDTPSKEIDFFATHERLDEVSQFFLKDDALEVLMMYTAQGNKRFYLNDVWKEMDRFITSLPAGNEMVGTRLNTFRMNIMGSQHSPAEKSVEAFGAKLFVGAKKVPGFGKLIAHIPDDELANMGKQILRSTMSLTYMSTMGWKPFLAIRNAVPPLVLGSPFVGLDYITRAYKQVLDNPNAVMDRLRKLNVFPDKTPVVNQFFGEGTLPGKLMEKSMYSFKNADELSRAVTYTAAENRFSNAVSALQLGNIKTKENFFSMSALEVVDPATQARCWDMVASGNPDQIAAATDLFANDIQSSAMFDYSGMDTPAMFNGVVGKLFGQFGTYSAGYRAVMTRMFRYGSKAKKAEMVATYLAMTGLMYAGFEAMRIKTNDFIPGASAIFGGGKLFNMGVEALRATGKGYEADQARASLKRELPSLIPGSAQLNYLKKSLEYSEAGDQYAAFMSLFSTPIVPIH